MTGRVPALALLLLAVAGCATAPARTAAPGPGTAELLEGAPIPGAAAAAPLPDVDVLALDDGLRQFLATRVPPKGPDAYRLRRLLEALIHDEAVAVAYADNTYTAAEAFRLRRANCLAFTNLFVALARAAGLDVHYQEVDIPPDWSASGDLLVQNRHVDAVVEPGTPDEQIIDFNMADFRLNFDRRLISDTRARAHYHSNVGAERLEAGEVLPAFRNFRKALALDPAFVPAWINLGALYERVGQPAYAEAAWREAVRIAPREFVALSNLERLYRAGGRVAEADALRTRVDRHRLANPYYRYRQGQLAFAAGDYPGAIRHLRDAIRRKPDDDRFYALLGLASLRNGDPGAARRYLARAAELAADESARQAYHGKLELLRRGQEPTAVRGS